VCCVLCVVGCGLWVVGCGLWVVGCGLWVVGCGLWVVHVHVHCALCIVHCALCMYTCLQTQATSMFCLFPKSSLEKRREHQPYIPTCWLLVLLQQIVLSMCRAGQNRVYAPYMTVYLVTSLPKILYIQRIYIWLWPTLTMCARSSLLSLIPCFSLPQKIWSVCTMLYVSRTKAWQPTQSIQCVKCVPCLWVTKKGRTAYTIYTMREMCTMLMSH